MPSLRGAFTAEQREVLLRPIMPSRVSIANGMAHVEAFDVIEDKIILQLENFLF